LLFAHIFDFRHKPRVTTVDLRFQAPDVLFNCLDALVQRVPRTPSSGSKVAGEGDDPEQVARRLSVTGEEVVIWIEALTAADCMEVGRMRPATKAQGLSLADRACLALAERLGVPALTTDREWAKADVAAEVQLIR
jgi:hypothetical protein